MKLMSMAHKFILSLTILFLLVGCGAQEEEKEGFRFPFEGQSFFQAMYREIDSDGLWFKHQGSRTLRVEPNKYTNVFNNYLEYVGYMCFGKFESTFEYVSQKEFQDRVNGTSSGGSTGGGSTGGSGHYDPHDPYDAPVLINPSEEEKAEYADYFMISTIQENNVTVGCNFPVEIVQYTHFRLFQNGDLIVKDYNRRIEFWFKPL